MRIKNIIILVDSPFNKRDFDRFGIKTLTRNGFYVEVWDFTPFLHPLRNKSYIPPDAYSCSELKVFETQKSAVASIKNLNHKQTLIVSFLGFTTQTISIYRSISLCNIKYGFIIGSSLPLVNSEKRAITRTYSKITKLFQNMKQLPLTMAKVLLKILPMSMLRINPPKFVSVPSLNVCLPRSTSKETDIIHACSFDYNLYLASRIEPDEADLFGDINVDKPIVFLDEFLPFHPDYVCHNVLPPCTPEQYYPVLISFFETVEAIFSSEVVIAAHPRSNYVNHSDYFGSRKIFFGKTHQLVKHSPFIITHGSTSINFAIIHKKPICFVSLEVIRKYKQFPLNDFYRCMAQSLGKQQIFIDKPLHDVDWHSEMNIDLNAYKKYYDSYVKSPLSSEKNSWEIFSDYASTL